MNTLKKLALIMIAIICIIFVISPVDIFPGLVIDDIFYIIVAIASLSSSKQINA